MLITVKHALERRRHGEHNARDPEPVVGGT
jgi:hypothetical protein